MGLLGELQLSFLTVVYMNNFSGFETWKNLFTVFCGCKESLGARERLFRNFLVVLRHQFDVCSEETFNEIIIEGNFVANNLKVPSPPFWVCFLNWPDVGLGIKFLNRRIVTKIISIRILIRTITVPTINEIQLGSDLRTFYEKGSDCK